MSTNASDPENPGSRQAWKVTSSFGPGMTAVMPITEPPSTESTTAADFAAEPRAAVNDDSHEGNEWHRRMAYPNDYMP